MNFIVLKLEETAIHEFHNVKTAGGCNWWSWQAILNYMWTSNPMVYRLFMMSGPVIRCLISHSFLIIIMGRQIQTLRHTSMILLSWCWMCCRSKRSKSSNLGENNVTKRCWFSSSLNMTLQTTWQAHFNSLDLLIFSSCMKNFHRQIIIQ